MTVYLIACVLLSSVQLVVNVLLFRSWLRLSRKEKADERRREDILNPERVKRRQERADDLRIGAALEESIGKSMKDNGDEYNARFYADKAREMRAKADRLDAMNRGEFL